MDGLPPEPERIELAAPQLSLMEVDRHELVAVQAVTRRISAPSTVNALDPVPDNDLRVELR